MGCAARSRLLAVAGLFRAAFLRTRLAPFSAPGLSSDLCRVRDGARVDVLVAGSADDERLAPHACHERGPRGLARPWLAEAGELGDVVYRHGRAVLAQLAPPFAEPVDQLPAGRGCRDRGGVTDDRAPVALEGYPAESRNQIRLALPPSPGLKAGPGAVIGDDLRLVAGGHLGDGGLMLGAQGLQHGRLGVPAQPVQPPDVLGKQVVVRDTPVFGPVGCHDVVVGQVLQDAPVPGFSPAPVPGALGRDHVPGHAQRDPAVDRPAAVGDLRAGVLDGDLVAEEPRRASAGVGDQCFSGVQFQREGFPQELRQFRLDLLGLGPRPDESQQMVICVPDVKEPPVAGVHRVTVGQGAHLLFQFPGLFPVTVLQRGPPPGGQFPVLRIDLPAGSPGMLRDKLPFYIFVELVKVDVTEQRRDHAALRGTGKRVMILPVFHVPGLEHVTYQPEKPVVEDFLRQYPEKDLMIDFPEAVGDVPLDEPHGPGPGILHFPQCGMAASLFPETV